MRYEKVGVDVLVDIMDFVRDTEQGLRYSIAFRLLSENIPIIFRFIPDHFPITFLGAILDHFPITFRKISDCFPNNVRFLSDFFSGLYLTTVLLSRL